MKKGDEVLFYHSNEGVEIVGIAKVIKEAYQDPTTDEKAWVAVDIAPLKKLKQPITLKRVKDEPALAQMALLRLSRLSVQPVLPAEWKIILKMAGERLKP